MSVVNPGTNRNTSEINRLIKTLNLNKEEIINSVNLEIVKYEKKFISYSNIVNFEQLNIFFIIGIIEGDGSFYFGLRGNQKLRFGFNITTHILEIDLLYCIKFRLNCGNVKAKSKTWCRYEIEGNKMLRQIFIPLVDSFGLLGSKALKYKNFKEAMELHTTGEYKTIKGQKRILELLDKNDSDKINDKE